MTNQEMVVVAMSGGVDSSVAAALLVEQGYRVVGIMMRLWSEPSSNRSIMANRCCTPDQMADARRVAQKFNIPFYVLDVQDQFYDIIVRSYVEQHRRGLTPNPCIDCNRTIRFSFLLEKALSLGADYLATGHYARIQLNGKKYQLLKAIDTTKDQSYVLHVLGQRHLAHVKFPIGGYTKSDVREIAHNFDLPVAQKSDSMDLCFLADGDYRRFLADISPDSVRPGPIYQQDGTLIGEHNGLANYTIGQRKGLGITHNNPLYVLYKDVSQNALVVGSYLDLGKMSLTANRVNWVSGDAPDKNTRIQVKIRYRATPLIGFISRICGAEVEVQFEKPAYGVTAGQAAVFYDDEICIGGGIIIEKDDE